MKADSVIPANLDNLMKYLIGILFLAMVILSAGGCRSTRKIQTVITTKRDTTVQITPVTDPRADSLRYIRQVYDHIMQNKIDYRTFSCKVKVDFEGSDGKKTDFNVFIRLKKDSVMWISIIAVLGIEGFKILITPDSVKVIDKLQKVVQLRSVEYLREVSRIPMSFTELQDLLIGNPIYLDSNIVSYKKEEKTVSLISVGELFKHLVTVDNGDYSLQHSKLDDVDAIRARTADITYGGFENKQGVRFSTVRRITVSEKTKIEIKLEFKQWEFNEDLNFPFNIPRNYKQQ
jgi:hypothetical protein